MTDSEQIHKKLLTGYLAIARHELDEAGFEKINPDTLFTYISMASETVAMEDMLDKVLIRHALHGLTQEQQVEEIIMHVFLLHIFKLSFFGSDHPLEKGIIKQKVNGIMPVFTRGMNSQLIPEDIYTRNADALLHIINDTEDKAEILQALHQEYHRHADTT